MIDLTGPEYPAWETRMVDRIRKTLALQADRGMDAMRFPVLSRLRTSFLIGGVHLQAGLGGPGIHDQSGSGRGQSCGMYQVLSIPSEAEIMIQSAGCRPERIAG